ncbi:acyl-CoA dehydrogenase/oxidase [Tuber borchii]|uniref:short-chain 2-methylacyl-CoA dehydrogenase n=1 Tax=Tuber borchii TaxID=42251 RepID=A0A2T7A2G7_TUBBO|nr:acyl-CoA dehydrogenase/oxidase [Tuber borchii]
MATSALRTAIPRGLRRPSLLLRPGLLSAQNTSRRHFSDVNPTPIFHLTETEEMLKESVGRFARDVVLPKAREMDENEMMDKSIVEQLFEQGLMGVEVEEAYGGSGMGFGAVVVAIEELARIDPSVSVLVDVHNTLVNTAFRTYGSTLLKKKYLPKLATGTVGSFCLSEPASGSDAFALQTKAVKSESGGSYKITGQKMWITNAAESEIFIVFANIAPERGYKGITAFVVEKGMPGFNIAKKEKKLGIKASSTCVLTFDDVEVPADNLLGKEGEGYKYAISLLNEGRIGIAAQMTGLALGAWENAVKYECNSKSRKPELKLRPRAHYSSMPSERRKPARASQVAQKVSGSAIEWMGGMGFVREGLAEKYWRDSKIGAIYEGTSNIQLQTIAKLLQKEYKEQ